MTNYPTGPNRTTPHSRSYFLPPTPGQSRILSLTYTLQIRLIIYRRQYNCDELALKRTCCSYQRYAPTAQSSDIVSSYEQKRPVLSFECRDSTGTVSATVSARNNIGSDRSRNIFSSGVGTCDSPYKKLVCGPWGKVGSSKGESENSG